MTIYPAGESPFSICNAYRPPASNDENSFTGKISTEAFCPSKLSLPISNCVFLGDFNLELKDPPCCLAETNLAEWAHVHNLIDISDGDPTCIPPVNTAVDFEGRAIDLAMMDSSDVPRYSWEMIGSFSPDHAPILITIGWVEPPIQSVRSMPKYDFNNADWDRYRDGVRRRLAD